LTSMQLVPTEEVTGRVHLVIDCSRRPVRVQALVVAMGTVPLSGVGQMPVLVAAGGRHNPGPAPAVACQGCVL